MKKIKQISYSFLILFLVISYLINNAYNEINVFNKFISFTLITSTIILFVVLCISIYISVNKQALKDMVTLTCSTTILLLIIELSFVFIPRSHFFNKTLASKNWKLFYDEPINKLGYHDKNLTNKKPTILFVGDSFTQGHGIKNIEDRYSNKLETLNTEYTSVNIGKNGLDTKKEFNEMQSFISNTKIKPKIIVLQYFGNDIEGIAYRKMKKKNHDPYSNLATLPKFIIKGSYLINYLYWLYPHEDYKPYLRFLTKAYSNKEIVQEHFNDLLKFINYCRQEKIKLNVIIFPFLTDTSISEVIYEKKIERFFNQNDVTTIKVSDLIINLNKNECIVNSNDSHASIKVNELVAQKLIKVLKTK